MQVAIDISPLSSGHKVRGIGSYTQNLVNSLKTTKSDIHLDFFDGKNPPSDADVIHYPYFDLFFHTLPIRKKAKRVVTIHDVIPLVFPNYFPSGIRGNLKLLLQKTALLKSDRVIADSKTSSEDIENKLSYPKSQIDVIYLAPGNNFTRIKNTAQLKKVKTRLNLPDNFVLYVGDVNWNKNVSGVVSAAALAKVKLVMIGAALVDSSIPQTRQLTALIKKLDMEKEIIKTGFVQNDDLVAIYNLAQLTLLPSYYEGFGLPVLESLACGTPVVCSNNSSIAEVTTEEVVTYCDPTNPEDIAQKIKKTSLEKKNPEKLINYASKYSWDRVASETIRVYKTL